MLKVGIWAASALTACSPSQEGQNTLVQEPWSNEAEAIFQQAESLKFSLDRLELEQARSAVLELRDVPPGAGQPQPEQQQNSE